MRSHKSVLIGGVVWLLAAVVCGRGALGQGYICAEGGGSFARPEWSGPVVAWMVEKGQKGNVVILGAPTERGAAAEGGGSGEPEPAAGGGGPDAMMQRFLDAGAATVFDMRPTREAAESDRVVRAVLGAKVVFMRGGSQTRYIELWKGTRLEAAIREVFKGGGVVGGTSAGCAVLGEIIYDAAGGSCSAQDALTNGRTKKVSFVSDFLGFAPGVLFDTHFTERARLARLAVMLGRCEAELARQVLGIGVDTRTALCIDPDGTAEVRGTGAVTVLALTAESRIALPEGKPPLVTHLSQVQMVAGQRYDLKKRMLLTLPPVVGERAALDRAERDRAASASGREFKTLTIRGDALADSEAGQWRAVDLDDAEALWLGRVRLAPGEGRLRSTIVQTRSFEPGDFLQNRVGGVLWALARRPGMLGVWVSRVILLGIKQICVMRFEVDEDPDTA
ncbi:MAG: cyanophycinase, partial [Phycisphaerales bacterium]